MTNDWRQGIDRIPLHLVTFGILGALGTWFGGWGCAATLVAWRVRDEYLDWHEGRDTFAKAWIDLASQVGPAVVAVTRFL